MRLWPTVGTRSLLWGTHQFLLHPIMVALGWRRCYGRFPRDWRIWLAFLIHDWGYWGLRGLDTDEGQEHPLLGGWLLARAVRWAGGDGDECARWAAFAMLHSRYFAERCGMAPSRLMRADKMATVLLPLPLFLLLALASGEMREYIAFHHEKTGAPATVLGWSLTMRADWRRRYGHLEVRG